MELLHVLSRTWLGTVMRETPALFPSMEITHFVGLSLLMGALLVIDLRVLGAFKAISYAEALKLAPLATIGFTLNALSGVAFIATNPDLYSTNRAFWVKMALVVVAGVNALWFTLAQSHTVSSLAPEQPAPVTAKLMAGASLFLWTGVILLGRLLPTFAGVGGG